MAASLLGLFALVTLVASGWTIGADNGEASYEGELSADDRQHVRSVLKQFLREMVAKRAQIPMSGGLYGKRSLTQRALPMSGGLYGKRDVNTRGALPMSGGLYGKRNVFGSSKKAAIPMSGGLYGKRAAQLPISGGLYGK